MLAKVLSAAVYGIDANLIDVEVDLSGTFSEEGKFHTVGLPDAAVRESRGRVRRFAMWGICLAEDVSGYIEQYHSQRTLAGTHGENRLPRMGHIHEEEKPI